jgi:hypothetical protein
MPQYELDRPIAAIGSAYLWIGAAALFQMSSSGWWDRKS